jgi:hypothetical protein
MTRSIIQSTITFMVWSILAGAVTVVAWMPPISDNPCCHHRATHNHYRKNTILRVLSQEVSESLVERETTEEGTTQTKIPYVIARGDGSNGGGGLPMPQKHKNASSKNDEEDDENNDVEKEELRRPKVSAEMPLG